MGDNFSFEEAAAPAPQAFSFEDAQKPQSFSFEDAQSAGFKDLSADQPLVLAQPPRTTVNISDVTKGGPPVSLAPVSLTGGGQVLDELGNVLPDAVRGLARSFGYAGNVARAIPADLAAGVRGEPDESGNIPAAVAGEPLPIDAALQAAQSLEKEQGGLPVASVLGNISQGAAKAAPKLAALPLAGPGLLAQSIAAGGLFGLDDEGNFNPKEAVIGALLPGVGKLGRVATGALLGKGIVSGAIPYAARTTHKVIETLGEQAALDAVQVAGRSPELLKQWKEDPQGFQRSLAEIVGSNLGFAVLGADRFKAGVPSEAQGWVKVVRKAAKTATDVVLAKPIVQDGLNHKADYIDVEEVPEQGALEPGQPSPRLLSAGEPEAVGDLEAPPEPESPAKAKERTILERIKAGMTPDDLQFTVAKDPAMPGWGFVQVDDPREGNVFSSNPEQLTRLGMPMPGSTPELLAKLPAGRFSHDQVLDLLKGEESEVSNEPTTGQPPASAPGMDAGESATVDAPTIPAEPTAPALGPEVSGGPESGTELGEPGNEPGGGVRSGEPRSPGTSGRTGQQRKPAPEVTGPAGAPNPPEPRSPVTEPEPEPVPAAALTEADLNHRLPQGEDWIPSGDRAKIRANLEAVALLKKLEAGKRNPTPAEKTVLARYTGWGGLKQVFDEGKAAYRQRPPYNEDQRKEFANWEKNFGKLYDEVKASLSPEEHASAARSILNAHFTSREAIVHGLWAGARQLGFTGGNALEAGAGVGNILGLIPDDLAGRTHWRAVEKDNVSGRILAKLYPQAAVHQSPFEQSSIRNNSQDLMIGNVPFAKDGPRDKRYPNFSLHNYFLTHGMDLLKPGGLMAVITSDSTMDSPSSRTAREWLAQRSDLVGAIRLPNNAFKKNAGTEVTTDILFFRKHGGDPFLGAKSFARTEPFDTTKGPVDLNEYFAAHPEMMLGRMSREGTQYGPDQPALVPIPGANLPEQLAGAVAKLPLNIAQTLAPGQSPQVTVKSVGGPGKIGQLVEQDGKLWHVQADGSLEAPDWAGTPAKVAQAKRYIQLRDTARAHIAAMLDPGSTDGLITKSMVELNKSYDAYVARHGRLNARPSAYLDDDVDFPLALALEDASTHLVEKVKDGKMVAQRVTQWGKSKMFSERTIYPRLPPEHVDTVVDGLQVSLNFKSKVDVDYIAQLTGLQSAAVKRWLLKDGLAFENPLVGGQWETRAKYLSGFVRDKLHAAQAALKDNPEYQQNIDALQKVQPPAIAIENIGVKLGSIWVPPHVIEQFLARVLGVRATVTVTEQTGDWHVQAGDGSSAKRNTTTFGIHDWKGHELVHKALNLQTPTVTRLEPYVNSEGRNDTREVKDPAKSAEAAEKQTALQQEFRKFVLSTPEIAKELEQLYNDKFNGVVAPRFDPPTWSHYPGASQDITLRDHQKAVVSRMLENSTLLAHAVGTGKTYAMCTAAMEMRRLGLARKPMIVVQNATLEQFARSFKRLYPTARILAPGARQRDAVNRQSTMSRIATGDWDAVIVPQSFVNMLPDDPERERAYIADRLKELSDALIEAKAAAGKKSPKASDLQRAITRLEDRLESLKDRRTDNVLTFEQTGVDALFVDEAHAYKKLEFGTKMDNIKGLDTGASQRGLSMFFKVRWVQEHNQGRNVTFATGTPVSNTIAEAWNMMRFVRPDVLKAYGIEDFDSFASTFGDTVSRLEMGAGGGWKPVTRFARYTNGPELIAAWRTVADVVTPEEINLPGLPALKNGKPTAITISQTPRLTSYIAHLRSMLADFEAMSGREKRDNSHIPLVVFGLAKKATLDMRMIDPDLPDEPGSKLNRAADEITRIFNDSHSVKGAQMVFSDSYQDNPKTPRFNLYEELKAKLIERGIPADQIAIITSEIKDARREALFEKVNAGDIRVVIGSTERMGIGVNAQEHLIGLHHLDAPARPMDIEQRNGRALRQGNQNPEIEILQYGVEGTLDAAMYQKLATKQKFVNQLLRGDLQGRNFEDAADELSLSFEEQMAAFSGDKRAIEKVALDNQVRSLESLRSGHFEQIRKAREDIEDLTQKGLPIAQREAAAAQRAAGEYAKAFPEGAEVTLKHEGQVVAGKKAIHEYLDKLFERGIKEVVEVSKGRTEIGRDFNAAAGELELNGKLIALGAHVPADQTGKLAPDRAAMTWKWAQPTGEGAYPRGVSSGAGFLHSVKSDLERITIKVPRDTAGVLAGRERDLRELTGFVKQPFERETELANTRTRLAALDAELAEEGKARAADEVARARERKTQTHEMAPGAAAPPASPPRAPTPRPLVPGTTTPMPGSLAHQLASIQGAVAPQTAGDVARFTANLLRELNAKMANEMARAEAALAGARKDFDRTPLAKNYRYDPTAPLPRNLAFIDVYEGGNLLSLPLRERALAQVLRQMNDDWVTRVRALGGNALQVLLANYFPHVWNNAARAHSVTAAALSKRPLAGSGAFLHERTHELFVDGLAAGLLPVHDNPIDQWLLKKREVERYILAHEFINQMRAAGLLKFVHAFSRKPEGWATVDDRTMQVYGPPTVTIKEAYDEGMRAKTLDILAQLGIPHERLAKIGGSRWGYEMDQPGIAGTEQITTKFGGHDSVIWHEMGHALDNRYPDMRQRLTATPVLNDELRKLADLRHENQPAVSPGQQRYIRSLPEKMAVALQAYVHAPERMKAEAPGVYAELAKFIASHPELADINDIKPSLVLSVGQTEQAVGGLVKMGDYYMPAEAARVVKNFLSPGLNNQLWYRSLRETSNLLNAAQLGLSAFHLGFTSLDAAVSRLAIGLVDVSQGRLLSGAVTMASSLAAPVSNLVVGHKLKTEVLNPGTYPALADLVKALEAGGGRVGQDKFWQTTFSRRMFRAFHEGTATGYLKGVLQVPFALIEKSMVPILEYLVPRQKLGVFADMAKREMIKLGPAATPAEVRAAMARAWDSVDNRMGQMVYDNLFYNRCVKDLALLGFRAYGWQLGKYRELGGGVIDWSKQIAGLAQGKKPELTHRMAYMLALPILVGLIGAIITRLRTGENPKDYRDYFMPRNGELDANGREARVNLPSYLKDLLSMQKAPVQTVTHALNPLLAATGDMLQNKDYWGVNIFNPDDPLSTWVKDAGLFSAKQFVPFSVQSSVRAFQEGNATSALVLPFFGVVPVKRALMMTPAESLAADIIQKDLPVGGRTKESANHSQLLRELVKDIREHPPLGVKLAAAQASGQLRPGDEEHIVSMLTLQPLQYQVNKMQASDAMRVWRVASPQEKEMLREQVIVKLANSKTLAPDLVGKYMHEVAGR